AVGVGLLPATAAAARAVVTDQADVAEARVRLDAHVVGARGRHGEGAALAVAAAVRPAVVAAVGRYAATLDVQVRVAAAAGHGERQAGRTGRHFQRVHHIVTRGGRQAGDRHTLLQAALARTGLAPAGGLGQLAEEGQPELGQRHAAVGRASHAGQRVVAGVDVVVEAGLEHHGRRVTGTCPRGMVGAAVAAGVAATGQAERREVLVEDVAHELLQVVVAVVAEQLHVDA